MRLYYLSFVFLIVFAVSGIAQSLPVNEETGKITFLEVVASEKMTAKELYTLCKEFGAQKGWVLAEDETNDKLVFNAKATMAYKSSRGGNEEGIVDYTFSFFLKDGKYRYIVTDFVHTAKTTQNTGGKLENAEPDCGRVKLIASSWGMIKTKTKQQVEEEIIEIKKAVQEAEKDPAKNDDW